MMGRNIKDGSLLFRIGHFIIIATLILVQAQEKDETTFIPATTKSVVAVDCDPCIDTLSYKIKAIVHGSSSDIFWEQIYAAAVQTSLDMRVNLEMDLYDNINHEQMAHDIVNVAIEYNNTKQQQDALFSSSGGASSSHTSNYIDALVVSIPSREIEDAIKVAIDVGLPVFGLNSGYSVAKTLGLFGFVAMDENLGGKKAAEEFIKEANFASTKLSSSFQIKKALYINHEKGNRALEERYSGFKDGLSMLNNNANSTDVMFDELIVDMNNDINKIASDLQAGFKGCPYDVIFVGGASVLEHILPVLTTIEEEEEDCSLGKDILLGTFDVNDDIYSNIATGKILFTISQQQNLQGSLAIMMAAKYATTGKKLALSGESKSGVYFSGPATITLSNLPSDTLQSCEHDGFPICGSSPKTGGTGSAISSSVSNEEIVVTNSGTCSCIDRQKIRIGGVLHGVDIDSFWDIVFAASYQAADDMGIDLLLDRFAAEETNELIHEKMAKKIISLCQQGVDGLFVSIPSDLVKPGIEECLKLNVPVMSINSGAALSKELFLVHHISQLEWNAGYDSAAMLYKNGMRFGYCINAEKGNSALEERCDGFKTGIEDLAKEGRGVTYMGEIVVPKDNAARVYAVVEEKVSNDNGDINNNNWEGIGLLAVAPITSSIFTIHSNHPMVTMGTFDTSKEIYEAIEKNILVFAIDQEPYLQGYMPVVLLTWLAQSRQKILNRFIGSGPRFIEVSPSAAQGICESNYFEICPRPVDYELNQIEGLRNVGYFLLAVIMFCSILCAIVVFVCRNDLIIKRSQPFFLLMILLGVVIMSLTIIPLSVDDGVATSEGCSIACMATPWLFFIGFTVVFAALFSKLHRLNTIFKNANNFRRVKVGILDVMLPFSVLLGLNVILLLTWTLVDPMYWTREQYCGAEDEESSYGYCKSGDTATSKACNIALAAINFLAVILANVEAYKARKVTVEFNESRYVAWIMITMLQISIIIVPLTLLVTDNPQASYFVKVGAIFVICMTIILLIFLPKMIQLEKKRKERAERRHNATVELIAESSEHSEEEGLRILNQPSSKPALRRVSARLNLQAAQEAAVRENERGKIVSRYSKKMLVLGRLLEANGVKHKPLFEEAGLSFRADLSSLIEESFHQEEDEGRKTNVVTFSTTNDDNSGDGILGVGDDDNPQYNGDDLHYNGVGGDDLEGDGFYDCECEEMDCKGESDKGTEMNARKRKPNVKEKLKVQNQNHQRRAEG